MGFGKREEETKVTGLRFHTHNKEISIGFLYFLVSNEVGENREPLLCVCLKIPCVLWRGTPYNGGITRAPNNYDHNTSSYALILNFWFVYILILPILVDIVS